MNPAHREAIEIALKYDTRYRLAELNVKQKINQEWLEVYEQYEVQWKEIVNGLQAWLVTQGMESKQLDQQKLFRASGVPANLYKQLRDVLLECDPFATDQELKAIFVDERLSLWRNQLPQANNPSTRVDQVIDFLYRHSSKAGENALVSLLHVLCDRHDEADACHQHLTDLANALEKEIKSRNDVIDQPMIVTKQPNQENEKVVVVKLPSRESDKQKWHQVWQKIREYAVQGWNANDIGREIQQHPNDYTNLPISSKTLRSIIAAGNAGLFD
jgi:hypothetical protein